MRATGVDLLSAKMLQATATSIVPAVTSLFNLSLAQGLLPVEWVLCQFPSLRQDQILTYFFIVNFK